MASVRNRTLALLLAALVSAAMAFGAASTSVVIEDAHVRVANAFDDQE